MYPKHTLFPESPTHSDPAALCLVAGFAAKQKGTSPKPLHRIAHACYTALRDPDDGSAQAACRMDAFCMGRGHPGAWNTSADSFSMCGQNMNAQRSNVVHLPPIHASSS